ncbi:Asp23/Gls24 family envelope stress response protein [Serinibacter arcticus]|uniref:Asp23/Gls24 family envelope stress response protein n=1 Tax=Serinibacter arcticus TaxID=1655435 RepID=A0A4Z1E4F1_9MICO|nr:hypothetical protein [Serinibacter arcticus]TGO05652.1 hypothetical protein SERN_1656 [Serinibacter arcticus]
MSERSTSRLACGRDIDEVWERIESPPDEHELECPHCRNARSDLGNLARLTASQRDEERVDPDLEPDPAILGRIMAIARAEVRRGRQLPLDEPDAEGPVAELTVSEQAVSASARRAGDAVDGVQVERCEVVLVPGGGSPAVSGSVGSGPGGPGVPESYRASRPSIVDVTLQVSVSIALSIPEVAREMRSNVMRRVNDEVGIDVRRIHIDVRDAHDD